MWNRWSKNTKSKVIFDGILVLNDGSKNSIHCRQTRLLQLTLSITKKVETNEKACAFLSDSLENVLEKNGPTIESSKSGVFYGEKYMKRTSNMNAKIWCVS